MMEPNWFDGAYEKKLARADAREALKLIAGDARLIAAVKEALDMYDQHADESGQPLPGWGGPSRTQAIRTAIAHTISEQA